MGYHITLARTESKEPITEQEWKTFVSSRPELTLEPAEEGAHFITAILDGSDELALHYCKGDVFTKNPNGPRIIEYMASIAPHFDAVVKGDEGETFSTAEDWGTQEDWDKPFEPSPKTFWQREPPRGYRILLGLLLGGVLILIRHLFFDR
jgi:hypothetical protein